MATSYLLLFLIFRKASSCEFQLCPCFSYLSSSCLTFMMDEYPKNSKYDHLLSNTKTYNVLYFTIVTIWLGILCLMSIRCYFSESNLHLFFNCMQAAFIAITCHCWKRKGMVIVPFWYFMLTLWIQKKKFTTSLQLRWRESYLSCDPILFMY